MCLEDVDRGHAKTNKDQRSTSGACQAAFEGEPKSGQGPAFLWGLPRPADLAALVDNFFAVLFPGVDRLGAAKSPSKAELSEHLGVKLSELESRLEEAVFLGLLKRCARDDSTVRCRKAAQKMSKKMLDALPEIREAVLTDVQGAYDADPAATGIDEIVACYPGVMAIVVYRLAHRLKKEGADILPRMLTEHAHARTGIDIHPGAEIGCPFFIDHGTGIVVGETTIIGERVRIYQGVTLGALSVKKRAPDTGKSAEVQSKRHPTIEDDVIIYANATILGGDTVIGAGAVVGGNAWITYSVPPGGARWGRDHGELDVRGQAHWT